MNHVKSLLVLPKWHKRLIIFIVSASILIQLGMAFSLPESLSLSVDGERYLTLRDNLVKRHVFAIRDSGKPCRVNQPLYPMLLAAVWLAFGQSLLPVKLIQVLSNAMLMVFAVLLAWQLLPKAGRMLSVTLLISYPSLLVAPALIMTETLYTLLLVLSCISIVWSIQRLSLWGAVLSGVGMGLTMLTRSLTFFLPLALTIPFMWAFGRKKMWHRGAVFCLVFLAAYSLTLLPWAIRNYVSMGEFAVMSCERGVDFWVPSNSDWGSDPEDLTTMVPVRYKAEFLRLKGGDYYTGCEAATRFTKDAFQNIRENPFGYFKRKAKAELFAMSYIPLSRGFAKKEVLPPSIKEMLLFVSHNVQILLWILGLIGAIKLCRSYPAETIALAGIVAYFILAIFFAIPNTRFFLPIMPIVLLFAVVGILMIYEWLRAIWHSRNTNSKV